MFKKKLSHTSDCQIIFSFSLRMNSFSAALLFLASVAAAVDVTIDVDENAVFTITHRFPPQNKHFICFLIQDWVQLRRRQVWGGRNRGQGRPVRQQGVLLQGWNSTRKTTMAWANLCGNNAIFFSVLGTEKLGGVFGLFKGKRQSRDYCSFDKMNWVRYVHN